LKQPFATESKKVFPSWHMAYCILSHQVPYSSNESVELFHSVLLAASQYWKILLQVLMLWLWLVLVDAVKSKSHLPRVERKDINTP
jgi:hypothetical protein